MSSNQAKATVGRMAETPTLVSYAAYHDFHAKRTSPTNHPPRRGQSARLGQFDVDRVKKPRQR
jgi:hypothetical protein